MTKKDWLHFVEENREEFEKVFKGERAYSCFDEKFENISSNCGASKWCLIDKNSDWVIKWDKYLEYGDTEHEYQIYQKAIEKGIAFLFPETEILCKINGYIIVIQRKIDCSYNDTPCRKLDILRYKYRTVSRELINKVDDNIYDSRLPKLWTRSLICIYGKKITRLFEEFTHEQKINDLHPSNVGFLNGKPIVLDFSGYHH